MIAYLNAQIEAGAQAVQIFDTWGGSLSQAAYREFSLAYMQRIVDGLNQVQNVVSNRTTLPILSNVLLRATGETLELTTTDIHLAHELAQALHHAYHGDLKLHYTDKQVLLRAHWQR
mgnify:CR=1 FL=1